MHPLFKALSAPFVRGIPDPFGDEDRAAAREQDNHDRPPSVERSCPKCGQPMLHAEGYADGDPTAPVQARIVAPHWWCEGCDLVEAE